MALQHKQEDKVRITRDIVEHPTGDSPGGICALAGDTVIVRRVSEGATHPYHVSHEDRTDGNTFRVDDSEIEQVA